MTPTQATALLTQPTNATQDLAIARALEVKGEWLKNFRNGQELREYVFTPNRTRRIRAFRAEHNV